MEYTRHLIHEMVIDFTEIIFKEKKDMRDNILLIHLYLGKVSDEELLSGIKKYTVPLKPYINAKDINGCYRKFHEIIRDSKYINHFPTMETILQDFKEEDLHTFFDYLSAIINSVE